MSVASIVDLPDLALSLIASYLDIDDLLAFRSVNKSLYSASFRLCVLGNIVINLDRSLNDIESLSRFLLQRNAIKKVMFKISRNFNHNHWKNTYMSRMITLHISNIEMFQEVCRKCPKLESVTYTYKKTDFRNRKTHDNLLKDMIVLSKLKKLKHFSFDGKDSHIPMAVFSQLIYSVPYLLHLELHSIIFFNHTGVNKESLQFAISQMTCIYRWEQNNVFFPYKDVTPPACVKDLVIDVDVPYDNHDSDSSNDDNQRPHHFSLINLTTHAQLERLELSQSGGPHIEDKEVLVWDINVYSNLRSLKIHSISLSEDYLLCHQLRDLSLWKCDGVKNYLLHLSGLCALERMTLMEIDKFRDSDLVKVVNKFKGLKELRLWSMNSLTCAILTSIKLLSLKVVEIYDCKHMDNNQVGVQCIKVLREILPYNIKVEKEKS